MAKPNPRRPGDAAGVGPYARERERLVPMSELRGWNVKDGESDIRSWEVRTLSGKVLGSVRDLLIDREEGEVVMIDVDIAGSDRHGYLPLRVVEIDRTRRVVRADSGDLEEYETASETARFAEEEAEPVKREVRYATRDSETPERVVERRPIIEETVIRRRDVGDPETRL